MCRLTPHVVPNSAARPGGPAAAGAASRQLSLPLLLLALLLIPFVLCVRARAESDSAAGNAATGETVAVVQVRGDHAYPPYEFLQDGVPAGFNIELIRAVLEAAGLQAKIELGPWEDVRRNLQEGRTQVLAGMYYSKERAETFGFSVPHVMVSSGLFFRRDRPVKNMDGLGGRKVLVQEGDIMHDLLRASATSAQIVPVRDPVEALRRLSEGDCDAALLSSNVQGLYFMRRFGWKNIDATDTGFPAREYCFATAKDNEALLHQLNEGLAILKNDGRYRKIHETWFGVYEESAPWRRVRPYVFAALILLSVLTVGGMIWSWMLKRTVNERTQELRNVLSAASQVAIIATDVDGIITTWNTGAEHLLGYTAEEMVRRRTPLYFHIGYDIEALEKELTKELGEPVRGFSVFVARARRDGHEEREWTVRRSDGASITVSMVVTVVRDTRGEITGYLGVAQDITARKHAEAEREKLQVHLAQIQKMESIGQLAGGVAHDFNNMIQAILGNAYFALTGLPEKHPARESIEEIRTCAQRSGELTRQLLAFARKQTIAPKVLNLNETVEGMLKMLRRLIGEDIELTWNPGQSLAPILMDPSQIDQILANLCVNARDAIGGVGRIVLETENVVCDDAFVASHPDAAKGRFVRLSIGDNGCGMTPEVRAHLFEPFFTTKALGRGTGLGLATVYGIVKQNGGFIEVHSTPGQGSTFHVHFPMHLDGDTDKTADSTLPGRYLGSETVLLVEDEPLILKTVQRLLEELGYVVLAAATPGEALRLAEERGGEIHLIITDVVMPEMNGRDLANRLLALHPDMKRLFMSGYPADVIAHHGVLEPGVHFIQKPFSVDTLAAKVRTTLEGRA